MRGLKGAYRHLVATARNVATEPHDDGVRITCTLDKGCYATVLLREWLEAV